jgi:hypothetical protein
MKPDPYVVYCYPDQQYLPDDSIQTFLTSRSRRGERIVASLFLGFVFAFLFGIIAGVIGCAWVAVAVIPLGFLLPVSFFLFLGTPRCHCTFCKNEMKKVWGPIEKKTGRQGLFVICEPCHRYAYTYKAERP